jgi:hypothetical protein
MRQGDEAKNGAGRDEVCFHNGFLSLLDHNAQGKSRRIPSGAERDPPISQPLAFPRRQVGASRPDAVRILRVIRGSILSHAIQATQIVTTDKSDFTDEKSTGWCSVPSASFMVDESTGGSTESDKEIKELQGVDLQA